MTGGRIPAPRASVEADVLVVGGGVTGLCAALFLARENVRVVCVDADRDAGSSANAGSLHVQMQSRLLRDFPELGVAVEQELPVYVRAVGAWQRLIEETGADFGLRLTGGLMVAEDEAQLAFLAQKVERERARGLEMEFWERPRIDAEAPYLSEAVVGAAFCALEGKVDPLGANRAIARAALEAGAVIKRGTRVTGIVREAGGLRVVIEDGEIRCGRMLIAAGVGSRALAAQLALSMPIEAEPLQVAITEAAAALVRHLVQHADRPLTMKQLKAGQVVIGGGWPARPREGVTPPSVLPANLLGNIGLARHIVPGIGSLRLLRTWAGVNPVADGRSIVGSHPGAPHVFFAVPGDAGYTLGPLVARLAIDCLMERTPALAIDRYRPDRFAAASATATAAAATAAGPT